MWKDVQGQELYAGDVVVVANRRGSRQWLNFRLIVRIDTLGFKHDIYTVSLDNEWKQLEKNNPPRKYNGHSDMIMKVR